ncbi:MAG: serine hydrolase domain-containing protein [Longimicrobiales bacterium]
MNLRAHASAFGIGPSAVAALMLLPVMAAAQVQPGDSATIAAVADSIAAEVLKAPVAGVAIGVARGDDVVFSKAYGLSDVAADAPLTLDDDHQIGSLTKQFTAAAVMQLVEQGRIALDDPIQKHLPDFDTQGHTVTIHHLLNHTSGIRSYTAIYGMNPVPRETVLDTIQKHAYDFTPGERFLYNNSGYYLLGPILEAVTGMPYAGYLRGQIFEPLGMESTSYCGYEGREVPVGYAPGDNGLTTAVLSDMEFPGAAGGLCSTVSDLLAWQRALVTGEVASASSYERMTTPASLESGETMTYGYGLGMGELEGERRIAHGGGIPGYNTYLSYYPADSLGIVVLVNTTPGHTGRIEDAVARAALGLPRNVVVDLPLTPEENARYVGTFDLGDLDVRVFEQDGVLMAQATNQRALRMKYQGEHTFVLDAPQEIKLVFELEGDRASGFTLHQGGETRAAPRIDGAG